jgi:hypothetical protein
MITATDLRGLGPDERVALLALAEVARLRIGGIGRTYLVDQIQRRTGEYAGRNARGGRMPEMGRKRLVRSLHSLVEQGLAVRVHSRWAFYGLSREGVLIARPYFERVEAPWLQSGS